MTLLTVQGPTLLPSAGLPWVIQSGDVQAQIAQLEESLVSLQAQRGELARQINAMSPAQADLVAGLKQQLMELDQKIVTRLADIAGAKAVADRQGIPIVGQPTLPPGMPGGPPWMIEPDVISGLLVFITVAIVVPISVGITRRLWRRTPKESPSPILEKVLPRLDQLERSVDAIAIEVERISEGQRFVTKVLTERPLAAPHPPHVTPNDVSALGDAKPFRALGAGPIEPIRAPDRQSVRQSITPH